MDKFLVVGLGNPGENYKKTRHNVGFMALDYFSQNFNQEFISNICNGSFYKFIDNESEVYILKPQTFMNLSGKCVREFITFYKIKIDNILVIYDDLYVPFGKIKIKKNGSDGGHNGIKNIINELKTQNIKRIKIGIGTKNSNNKIISNFVLSNFSNNEIEELEKIFKSTSNIINKFYKEKFDKIISEIKID